MRPKLLPLLAAVVFALLPACDGDDDARTDGGTGDPDGGGPNVAAGACVDFGVTDPLPLPEICPLELAGDGDGPRVFAVGQVVRYAEMTDYAAFCRTWDEVVRTYVVPCLATDRPNLLVFPENATLAAAFIGSRGEAGRAATETLAGFFPFFDSYAGPYGHYGRQYPESRTSERLFLALTDTFLRAFQTFHAIARTYEVHVAVSADMAPAERTTDPQLVSLLADPDLPDTDHAWVATGPHAYNWGVFIGPDGEELARVAKAYLVPDEENLLELTHGALLEMRPVDLDFARAGMVISKDAWMPDVLWRLDVLGADLMLQPEAFSGWGVAEWEGDWLPDIVKAAGWAHTQRSASFRHNVTPCIKGNLLSLVYDCQSHITKDARPDDPPMSFVGQDPYPGLLAVEPWVIEDPGAPLSLEERRAVLRERGEKLAPGSGDPLEDRYANRVVAADLPVLDGTQPAFGDGAPGALGTSRIVVEPLEPQASQRFPELAVDGDRWLLVFTEGTAPQGRVRVAASDDAGDTFAAVAFFDGMAEGPWRRAPAAALAGDRRLVAWEQEDAAGGTPSVRAAFSLDAGASWQEVDPTGGAAGLTPAVAVDPADGTLYVAWLDPREGGRPKPWLARSTDGASWTAARVEAGNAVTNDPRGHAAFVQVAARAGTVHVAFSDFRAYAWDVYLVTSADAGATWGAAQRVNPPAEARAPAAGGTPVETERLHGDVRLALDAEGAPVLAWSSLENRRADTDAVLLQGGTAVRVDDAPDGIDAFRPAFHLGGDGRVVAAWQDLRDDAGRIRMAVRPAGAEAFGASAAVMDADPRVHGFLPRPVALDGGGTAVLWEDWREGTARLRVAIQR